MLKSMALACLVLCALPLASRAVVIRQGMPDANYRVPDNALPALVDLPGEGHGLLIDRRWVLTAAHATIGDDPLDHVTIHGKNRRITEVIRYPGYEKPDFSKTTGDASIIMAKLASLNDIALIRLADDVDDVHPIALYRKSDELGKKIELYGKGATGNGSTGEIPNAPHRGPLRRAFNVVTGAKGHWLDYTFDCSSRAVDLEGVTGGGDSGGPVLIQSDGQWKLAGLTSWKQWHGDISTFKAGVCGQVFSNTRVSYYAHWIDETISNDSSKR